MQTSAPLPHHVDKAAAEEIVKWRKGGSMRSPPRNAERRRPRQESAASNTKPDDATGKPRHGFWQIPIRGLMGPPVSRRKQRKLGINRFVPGIGYGKRNCSRCGEHTWLGPTQLAHLEAEPSTEVICQTCAQPELIAGLRDGSIAWTHPGGRGGGYYQNGKYFGPPEDVNN
jgi:hypothetical protein